MSDGLTEAQLRARKRQEKIKSSASNRLNKVIGTARGDEGADYLKTDTPFDRRQAQNAGDPDDIDLSVASTQRLDAGSGFVPPSPSFQQQGAPPDLMSMFGGDLPPEMADNPLFSMLQNMTGQAGFPPMQQQQQMQQQMPQSLWQRGLPMLHLLSMIGLIVWAVYNTTNATQWHTLHARRSTKEILQSLVGLHRPLPLIYAFVTVQLILQSLQLAIGRNNAPAPTLLNQILPMLPRPFNLWIGASVKYYALLGTILDDLAVVLVGMGLYIAWADFTQ